MDPEKKLNADFDEWFAKLQAISDVELTAEDWPERWFDGYTPAQALAAGPEHQD